jgi:hypothetical protein
VKDVSQCDMVAHHGVHVMGSTADKSCSQLGLVPAGADCLSSESRIVQQAPLSISCAGSLAHVLCACGG